MGLLFPLALDNNEKQSAAPTSARADTLNMKSIFERNRFRICSSAVSSCARRTVTDVGFVFRSQVDCDNTVARTNRLLMAFVGRNLSGKYFSSHCLCLLAVTVGFARWAALDCFCGNGKKHLPANFSFASASDSLKLICKGCG